MLTSYVQTVGTYFNPIIHEDSTRALGENVAAFVAVLCEYFKYKDDQLKEMLRVRDRLVCGVQHGGIQKLISEKDLTYERTLELASRSRIPYLHATLLEPCEQEQKAPVLQELEMSITLLVTSFKFK